MNSMAENTEQEIWQSPDRTFSKRIIQQGKGLAKPNDGSKCLVHITPLVACNVTQDVIGYNLNEDIDLCLGNGRCELSEIFDACMESMKEYEIAELLIQESTLKMKWPGFKCNSKDKDHPSIDGVVFKIELKSFLQNKNIWELNPSEKLTRAVEFKEIGTDNFKRGKFDLAERFYTKCLKVLVTMGVEKGIAELRSEETNQYKIVKCSSLLNLAACQLKKNEFEFVIEHCTNALIIDPKNVKGLFRRGQAYTALNEFEEAKVDLKAALALEPKNKSLIAQMRVLDAKVKKHTAQYKKGMSKMFGGPI